MEKCNISDLLKKINFGDIDGLYDPKISEYFIDYEFKDAILNKNIFFVIGRKGTGKSAIYNWIYKNQVENNNMIANLSFNNFPFEKLLELSDDSFAIPNQYQSIWRNIIYSEIASLLVLDQSNPIDDDLRELKGYTDHVFGSDLTDLHKQVTKTTQKTDSGLSFKMRGVGYSTSQGNGKEVQLFDGTQNITKINSRLDNLIRNYLKRNVNKKYIIQFDQLDDNYTSFVNNSSYTQCIISLFKAIYDINQKFRSDNIPVKSVAYLRSDIYNKIDQFDAESARWDQYKLNLNWAVVNRDDWNNPKLLQILNKRISLSIPEIKNANPFNVVFDNRIIKMVENDRYVDIFKFIIHRTFQRPRDVIQFCIKIQDECNSTNTLFFRTVRNAEKEFSLWLLSEVENEIAPIIINVDALYELLRLMGQNAYSITDFKKRFSSFANKINYDPEELLKVLYTFGIIYNINFKGGGYTEYFSIVRNDRSVFNRDLKIATHRGFYQGLYTSKFLKRQ
jgi:hypothetical protein